MSDDLQLLGTSLLGASRGTIGGGIFHGVDPVLGDQLYPAFHSASTAEVDTACRLALQAFEVYGRLPGGSRAQFLRSIADTLVERAESIVSRAILETGLPKARLQSEMGRTVGQLRLFADLAEEGSWVNARIDRSEPTRTPLPKPDVRSMMRPLGPVAVFCASNFPLAFSVAGGDTASALAAGCPVVVNAHHSHPGTAELTGLAIQTAVSKCGLPEGMFSLIISSGYEIGLALVEHPAISAVGFTGSRRGGEQIMESAAGRATPIPVFAEMSSTNPVVVLPEMLRERPVQLAEELFNSFTLGCGQFCTNPGLVFVKAGESCDRFVGELAAKVRKAGAYTVLNAGIQTAYTRTLDERSNYPSLELVAASVPDGGSGFTVEASLFRTKAPLFVSHPELQEEMFGPSTLVIVYQTDKELNDAVSSLHGHLTGTVHGTEQELNRAQWLFALLERKVGRLVINGYPTGVEVCHAMVHGGPYPATSKSQATSVGTRSVYRFARPVCYQNMPDGILPAELQNVNPLAIFRMIDGVMSREPL